MLMINCVKYNILDISPVDINVVETVQPGTEIAIFTFTNYP